MNEEKRQELEERIQEIERKVTHLRWLRDIASDYSAHIRFIEKEKDYYRCDGLRYSARGEGRYFELNPHRPIKAEYIIEGLREALDGVNREIVECENELEEMLINRSK